LRRWLAQLETHGRAPAAVLPFDIAEVDVRVPGGGLALGHFHEVIEGGAASEFAGLATLFAAGIAARIPGPVLWCLRGRDLFAPALARIGLDQAAPRSLYRGERRIEIIEIMDQWYGPGYRYVKVRGQDRSVCILRFDEIGDRAPKGWQREQHDLARSTQSGQ
jgi:hypothetical protein